MVTAKRSTSVAGVLAAAAVLAISQEPGIRRDALSLNISTLIGYERVLLTWNLVAKREPFAASDIKRDLSQGGTA